MKRDFEVACGIVIGIVLFVFILVKLWSLV